MALRILLADDHPMFRGAIRRLLEAHPDVKVVAEVGDGQSVLDQARDTDPEVVCMDVYMPGLNGPETTRRLVSLHAGIKVVALSAYSDLQSVEDMFAAGALAYVSKSDAGEYLGVAISAVRRNDIYLSPDISAIVRPFARPD